jgi:hypothetical protein
LIVNARIETSEEDPITGLYIEVPAMQTNGCACCSKQLRVKEDRNKIIRHLREQITVAREACKVLGIPFDNIL